jgi:hypothetical protein
MTKATVNFLAVNGSSLERSVTSKISLVDTRAAGYRNGGHQTYAKLLGENSLIVDWRDKERLVELVEQVDITDQTNSA